MLAFRMAQAFEATHLRSFFGAWSMHVKAEVMRRGMVTKAAARMAAGSTTKLLRDIFVAWDDREETLGIIQDEF